MTERKADTIKLGNFNYAKVATRLKEFLEDYQKDVSIDTTAEFKDGWVVFKAVVTCPRGVFTGHSLGQVGKKDKAFEKQETIAVGRALAFAGYLASGEIASLEEMQELDRTTPSEVSIDSLKQLQRDWWETAKSTVDKDDAATAFSEWAESVCGIESFAAANHREWTADDLSACRKRLNEAGAAALAESGLKKNGGGK